MFIFETITAYLFVYLFQITPTEILQLSPLRILAILVSKTSFFLVIWLWISKIPPMTHIHDKKKRVVTFILLFNVIIIYMTFILYRYMEIGSSSEYLILVSITLAALLFSWLIFELTKTMVHQEQQEEIMRLKIREYEKQDFYIKNMEDLMMNIRSQRHDLNNYVSTLYGLIQLEQIEEAKKYMVDLEKNISCFNQIIDTKHPVIIALINIKYQKAIKQKINIDFDINLPEKLFVEYVDLSIILGNLLDNAIEACIKSGNETPKIELKMHKKANYLVIKEENSKSKEIVFKKEDILQKYTTKEDKENHGFGLQNIQRVVEQYEGILKLEDDGNIFKVHIALPQKGSTK
ncbi:sensor histidine kinase [Anaerovirgula multivorans]|nr:sensor histidine kinase [Anaerovirgula multivorans]